MVLRALDSNNTAAGLWYRVDEACNSSVVYLVRDTREGVLKANWQSPQSMNTTSVEIQ